MFHFVIGLAMYLVVMLLYLIVVKLDQVVSAIRGEER